MSSVTRASRLRRALVGVAAPLIVVASAMAPVGVVAAEPTNMVLVWNENAVNVIHGATTATPPGLGQAPPPSVLSLAMVQGAIYDAVNAIDRGHQPYLHGLSAPSTASKAAAVAQAAHDVLIGLVPGTPNAVKTRVDDMLAASLSQIDSGQPKTDGITIGAQAAAAMLAARANDGRFDVEPFPTSNDVGKWRLVPPANLNVFGQFATVTPLTLKSPDQFRTDGPAALDTTSPEYAAEFNEVKALGAQSGSSRTPEQTLLAGFVFANPVIYMNKGLRDISTARGLSTVLEARLFAKASFAAADALIACWNDKRYWLSWRPQTAIREAANDGNQATVADPNWLSLFATPGYPEQPSGYNCFTQATWYSARLFFGTDKMSFQLTSPGAPAGPLVPLPVPGSTRSYTRFSDVARDTIEGRILTGFHFRTADVDGAWIGKKAAQWVDKHEFQPID
jgi:vanadium-dependent haloperoxidase-like protein